MTCTSDLQVISLKSIFFIVPSVILSKGLLELMVPSVELPLVLLGCIRSNMTLINGDDYRTIREELCQHPTHPLSLAIECRILIPDRGSIQSSVPEVKVVPENGSKLFGIDPPLTNLTLDSSYHFRSSQLLQTSILDKLSHFQLHLVVMLHWHSVTIEVLWFVAATLSSNFHRLFQVHFQPLICQVYILHRHSQLLCDLLWLHFMEMLQLHHQPFFLQTFGFSLPSYHFLRYQLLQRRTLFEISLHLLDVWKLP